MSEPISLRRVVATCKHLSRNPLHVRRITRILELPTIKESLAVSFGTAAVMWTYSEMVTAETLSQVAIETIFELWGKQLDTVAQRELNAILREPEKLPKYPIAIMLADRRYASIHYPERDTPSTSRTFDLQQADWCPIEDGLPATMEGLSYNLAAVARRYRAPLRRISL